MALRSASLLIVACIAAVSACRGEATERSTWDGSQWRIAAMPSGGAKIARQTRFVIELERLPLPSSVNASTVRLRSGMLEVSVDLSLQPVTRTLWVTPRKPLDAEVDYTLDVRGIVDLDGEALPEPLSAMFRTSSDLGPEPEFPKVDVPAVLTLMAAKCGSVDCHAGSDAATGLDLASASGIEATAKIHAASEAYFGDDDAAAGRATFYVVAPLIIEAMGDHGEPARSYLMYKVLDDSHIVGDPMPPAASQALTASEIQLISNWILGGAPTR